MKPVKDREQSSPDSYFRASDQSDSNFGRLLRIAFIAQHSTNQLCFFASGSKDRSNDFSRPVLLPKYSLYICLISCFNRGYFVEFDPSSRTAENEATAWRLRSPRADSVPHGLGGGGEEKQQGASLLRPSTGITSYTRDTVYLRAKFVS